MLRTVFLSMLLIGLLVLVVSCGNQSNAENAEAVVAGVETLQDSSATVYACPMKEHQNVTSETPGKCAACGMEMVAMNQAGTDSSATVAGCPMSQGKGAAGCAKCTMHEKKN